MNDIRAYPFRERRRHIILYFVTYTHLAFCVISAYNMVACRITDARNGGQIPGTSQVPLKK